VHTTPGANEENPIANVRRIQNRSIVKWFDTRRGFGFIVSPEGNDIFVHYSCIRQDGFRTLEDGEEVEYVAACGEKGWYALEVYPTGTPCSNGTAVEVECEGESEGEGD